jgi:hypothetical protein
VQLEVITECLAIEIFHYEVCELCPSHIGNPEIGDIDNIGMPQTPSGRRFSPKPCDELSDGGIFRIDDLDCHSSCGPQMGTKIDCSHATFA